MDRSLSTVCILYNKGVKYAPYEAKWLEKTHLHDNPLPENVVPIIWENIYFIIL